MADRPSLQRKLDIRVISGGMQSIRVLKLTRSGRELRAAKIPIAKIIRVISGGMQSIRVPKLTRSGRELYASKIPIANKTG